MSKGEVVYTAESGWAHPERSVAEWRVSPSRFRAAAEGVPVPRGYAIFFTTLCGYVSIDRAGESGA